MTLVSVLQVVTFLQPRFDFMIHSLCLDNDLVKLSLFFLSLIAVLENLVILFFFFDREEGWSVELIMGQLGKLKK